MGNQLGLPYAGVNTDQVQARPSGKARRDCSYQLDLVRVGRARMITFMVAFRAEFVDRASHGRLHRSFHKCGVFI
ncbi:hypothetical protein AG1IA_10319 [Rhizoctonia solani AG-1 IA]|uniref:Uncharacterized protein n=1 Tax=Thanatephorus cucumeris (strain AG1-IA) TaxID=983506 RepID=L8WBU3_THACA|nr:hypothetical protein AG1IA_10319 [Rhizoctonia solani AG-1 IA]